LREWIIQHHSAQIVINGLPTKQSLRLHILSCWPKQSAEEQGHAPFQHHPLKLSSYHGGKNDKTTFSHNHTDHDVDTVNSGDGLDDDFI
jgi:hypothetical protein